MLKGNSEVNYHPIKGEVNYRYRDKLWQYASLALTMERKQLTCNNNVYQVILISVILGDIAFL